MQYEYLYYWNRYRRINRRSRYITYSERKDEELHHRIYEVKSSIVGKACCQTAG